MTQQKAIKTFENTPTLFRMIQKNGNTRNSHNFFLQSDFTA